MSGRDQKLWIYNAVIAVYQIIDTDWVHMMNHHTVRDFMIRISQITGIVSSNNMMTNLSPFSRVVKSLVEVSVESKCRESNFTPQGEVAVSLLKCFQSTKLGI